MSFAYSLYGFKLASDLALPELPPWRGDATSAADIAFRLGPVPEKLEDADHTEAVFQTRGDSLYLFSLPGMGRSLVKDGRDFVVEPDPGADPMDMGRFLMGPVQAVLWHQRGLLPLHATLVTVDGMTIALAGPSGAGKSTLAAALTRRGGKVVADDMAVFDADAAGESVLLPGFARLHLWQDALDHFGISSENLQRLLSDKNKFRLSDVPTDVAQPTKLSAIVLISPRPSGSVAMSRLRGRQTIGALHRVVHMRRPAQRLGRDRQIFSALSALVGAGLAIWRCEIPRDLSRVDEAAAAVLDAVRG